MIPPLDKDGILPPGIHEAEDWAELAARFGGTPGREELLAKLRLGLDNLREAGCAWVLLDGSFVTGKPEPNDVDGCWEDDAVIDTHVLDRSFLLRTRPIRARLRERYGTDFFVASLIEASSGQPFYEFFQTDRAGIPKGIVRLDLAREKSGSSR
jgi:hypothetical protein